MRKEGKGVKDKNACTMLAVLIIICLVLSASITIIIVKQTDEKKRLIDTPFLIDVENQEQVQQLKARGIKIIESYESFLLAKLTNGQKNFLEYSHFSLTPIHDYSMIELKNIKFDTQYGEPKNLQPELQIEEYPPETTGGYYIVQFIGPIKREWKNILQELGVKIYNYLPNYAFIVKMNIQIREKVENLNMVQWIGIYQPSYKIEPNLLNKEISGDVKEVFIHIFNGEDLNKVSKNIVKLGGVVLDTMDNEYNKIIKVEIEPRRIVDIAQIIGVEYIEEYHDVNLMNNRATWVIQSGNTTSESTPIWDMGLHGEGQIVGVADTGVDYDHECFKDPNVSTPGPTHRKIIAYHKTSGADYKDSDSSGHGTHVTATVCGENTYIEDNSGNDNGRGMAYEAKLSFTDFATGEGTGETFYLPSDLNTMFQWHYDDNARIHSNSWSVGDNSYGSRSQDADQFMWNNQNFLILSSNGNEGDTGPGSVTNPASAKNVVSVGACKNGIQQNDMWPSSSRGPASDDRIKPTVVAPGWTLESADSDGDLTTNNKGYTAMGGTSMASPTVAGATALIRQYFTEGWYPGGTKVSAHAFAPSAALMKAMLMAGAVEMTGTNTDMNGEGVFPNNSQGWGRINLNNSLYFHGESRKIMVIDNTTGFSSSGQSVNHEFYVENTSIPLKVILVWTDRYASLGANPAIVNDLDLLVTGPDTTQYKGNVFSGKDPGHSVTGGNYDRWNVEEGIILPTTTYGLSTGTYTVKITAYNIAYTQPFALVINGGLGYPNAPDLTLSTSDIVFSNPNPNEEDIVTINATIHNVGNSDAHNVNVSFYDGDLDNGGTMIGTMQNIGIIPMSGTGNTEVNWDTSDKVEWHNIFVRVNPTYGMQEINHDNNTANKTIFVTPRNDATITNIEPLTDGEIYPMGVYFINGTVKNMGWSAQTSFDVNCEIRKIDTGIVLLDDNMEGGIGEWTHTNTGGQSIDEWTLGTQNGLKPVPYSGSHYWECTPNGTYALEYSAALITPSLDLTDALTANMSFWDWCDFEEITKKYDGGLIEVSLNGGSTWDQIMDPSPAYDGILSTSYGNPLGGKSAYCYDHTSWRKVTVNLTPYVGNTVKVRFNFGSDKYTAARGWFIDDVTIIKHIVPLETIVYSNTKATTGTMNKGDSQKISWSYDFSNVSEYKIVVKNNLTGDSVPGNDEKMVRIRMLNLQTFNIPLISGWNLISIPFELTLINTSLSNALQSINNSYDIVQYYDASDTMDYWKVWSANKPEYMNDLQSINNTMGLWIHINISSTTLSVTGAQPEYTNIKLKGGWNLIGYPSNSTSRTVYDVKNEIETQNIGVVCDIIQGYDPDATYHLRNLDNSEEMSAGQGYWLHVTDDCEWKVYW